MTYRFGVFQFGAESGELRRDGRVVPLERQPARVLAVLLARAGELVTREELRDTVWGSHTHVDFDRGLAYCLSHIRRALGDRGENPRFVQTLPKRGYKFIAPVTVDAAVPSIPPATPSRINWSYIVAALCACVLAATAVWLAIGGRHSPVLVAVSVFDNESGIAAYDRPVAGLADLVVANLANLAPGELAVIGNAETLRRPRNIRNLKAVKESVQADYVLLGQLQQGEAGLRFVTHFIRLRDMAHLKAKKLQLTGDGISGLEAAVVGEFERAAREHVLTGSGN